MPPDAHHPHLVVTGAMGVGKTTTARALATRLGYRRRDSDADIETLFGATAADLAGRAGVDELHRVESAVLLGALADDRPSVIAAAAWVVEDPRCREALARRATVIVLDAPTETVIARARTGGHRRPIDRSELEALLSRRAPLFDHVADLRFDATSGPADLVDAIVDRLGPSTSSGSGPDGR